MLGWGCGGWSEWSEWSEWKVDIFEFESNLILRVWVKLE